MIHESKRYTVTCDQCDVVSRKCLSRKAAEQWQTTHAETHTDPGPEWLIARLVQQNTELTRELNDQQNINAALRKETTCCTDHEGEEL